MSDLGLQESAGDKGELRSASRRLEQISDIPGVLWKGNQKDL